MDLVVAPDGTIRAVYAEDIDLGVLGQPRHHQSQPRRARRKGPLDRRPYTCEGTGSWAVRSSQRRS